ncbi:MAG: hypothetical protein IPM06_21085 [Rhizobiales bacterium]|nr:hypothetical protein [Hyphomicrobiales bacterium]
MPALWRCCDFEMAQTRQFLTRIGQQTDQPGRAALYDPTLHPGMVMRLAQIGEFPEVWAAEIGVSFMTLRNWMRLHVEFADAMEAARLLLEAYWTRNLIANRNNPSAKPGLYTLILRRFSHYYGPNAPDIWAWFKAPDDAELGPVKPSETPISQATTAELERRLEELRRRNFENQKDG